MSTNTKKRKIIAYLLVENLKILAFSYVSCILCENIIAAWRHIKQ